MKVLQILPELNRGGVERGTLELASYLVDQGHDSLVISNGGRLEQRLVQENSRHIRLPVHRKSLLSLRLIGVLRKIFIAEKPNIVHVRSRVPAWLAWLAWKSLPEKSRPKFVTTFHGFYSVNAYSRIMTKGEHIIAVSQSIKDHIIKHYNIPSQKITVIHRGVSNAIYYPDFEPSETWLNQWKKDYPQLNGQYCINLPGRISRWKGHEHFCYIIDALRKKNLRIHGTIAGSCHPRKQEFGVELRNLIDRLDLNKHITMLGDRDDLREVMSVSDAIVSLSLDPEAFGRVSLEAMSLGKPVAAYHHGGVAEQLDVMFPAGNVEPHHWQAAAELLESWYHQNPVSPATNTFTLDAMMQQTEKVYRDLLADS